MMKKIILVGAGWRAEFYKRVAEMLPDHFELSGVVCNTNNDEQIVQNIWKKRCFKNMEEAAKEKPDYMIAAVPGKAVPDIAGFCAQSDIPVMFETYCSETLDEMISLYKKVGHAPIQVAEQYPFQPLHSARIKTANSGLLGKVYQVQASFIQNYHTLCVIRRLLDVNMELPCVYGYIRSNEMAIGPTRAGDPTEDGLQKIQQELFLLDYGDKTAIGNYESNQQRSWVRSQNIHVRAERGEILNNQVTYLKDHLTPCCFELERSQAGENGNLEGFHLRGVRGGDEWLYRNPYIPVRMMDDEIAVAACMDAMSDYVDGGAPFYSLAESLQDQYISILIRKSSDEKRPIQAESQIWQ